MYVDGMHTDNYNIMGEVNETQMIGKIFQLFWKQYNLILSKLQKDKYVYFNLQSNQVGYKIKDSVICHLSLNKQKQIKLREWGSKLTGQRLKEMWSETFHDFEFGKSINHKREY